LAVGFWLLAVGFWLLVIWLVVVEARIISASSPGVLGESWV
jgi:hypothetical protein